MARRVVLDEDVAVSLVTACLLTSGDVERDPVGAPGPLAVDRQHARRRARRAATPVLGEEPPMRPGPPPPPPPPPAAGPFTAEVTPAGPLRWEVFVGNGLVAYGPDGGPFYWWGTRDYITRRARRLLWRLNHPTPPGSFTVTQEDRP